MNQFSGMEMAKQRQAEFLREARLDRTARAAAVDAGHRMGRLPGLWRISRTATPASARARLHPLGWRLSRP
jgi:hypothetical protein